MQSRYLTDNAKAWYRDKWFVFRFYTGQISFNNNCKNDHRKWIPESMRSAVFHELSHMAGADDDDDSSEWWSDNAHNVTTLEYNPSGFGLLDAIKKATARAGGNNCCPEYHEWAP
jgi:hypothetical protein